MWNLRRPGNLIGMTSSPFRTAVLAVVALLIATVLGRLVFTLAEPPFTGSLEYDVISPLGEGYFQLHQLLGGPAYVLSFVALAGCFLVLCRRRMLPLALIGAGAILYGGVVFSLTIVAEALPFTWAGRTGIVDESTGRMLFDAFNPAVGASLLGSIVVSQVVVGVGALLCFVAVLVARSTPRWLPVCGMAFLVISNLLPPLGRPVTIAVYCLQLALYVLVGLFAARSLGRQIGDDREHAAVLPGAGRETQLGEH
jgi:hypothetical protein